MIGVVQFDEVKYATFFQLKQTEFVLPPVVLKEHVVFEIEEKNNTGRKKNSRFPETVIRKVGLHSKRAKIHCD